MEKRPFHLIALDLDGTLLTNDKQLSPRNREALERAWRAGAWIVPSTGRLYRYMPDPVLRFEPVRYVIESNGAELYDARQDKVLDRQLIPLELAFRIFERLAGIDCIYDCYMEGGAFVSQGFYDAAEAFTRHGYGLGQYYASRRPVPDLRAFLEQRNTGLQKISAFFRTPEERLPLLRTLQEEFPETLVSTSVPCNIEINAAAANKGTAILTLCRLLEIDPALTIAFGDHLNDIPALKCAGCGVAMANADPAVKAVADYVTLSNEEDGVAAALEELMLF